MNRGQTSMTLGGERWDAAFSGCGRYRYALWRTWDPSRPAAAFVGLNPSTADAVTDDPTIRRCKRFARDWGHGGLVMLNLFAYVSTDPSRLEQLGLTAIGPENDDYLRDQAERAGIVVAAWGAFPEARARARWVAELLGPELHCLGLTADGSPRHPLRLPAVTPPMPFVLGYQRPLPRLRATVDYLCPDCGAEPGERCRRLETDPAARYDGEPVAPHPGRRTAWTRSVNRGLRR